MYACACVYECMYVQVYVYLYVLDTCMNLKKSYEVIKKSNGGSHFSKNNLCGCVSLHACVNRIMRYLRSDDDATHARDFRFTEKLFSSY